MPRPRGNPYSERRLPGSEPVVASFAKAMSSFTSMTEINHECLTVGGWIQAWANNLDFLDLKFRYSNHR